MNIFRSNPGAGVATPIQRAIGLSLLAALPGLACAQGFYAEVGYQRFDVDGYTGEQDAVSAYATGALAPDDGFGLGGFAYPQPAMSGYRIGALTFRGGYDFGEHWGVEAELGLGIEDGAARFSYPVWLEDEDCCAYAADELPGFEIFPPLPYTVIDIVEVTLERSVGLFLMGKWPLGERTEFYVRGGHVWQRIDADMDGLDIFESSTQDAGAYGIGVAHALGAVRLRLDFTSISAGGGADPTAVTLSIGRRFE